MPDADGTGSRLFKVVLVGNYMVGKTSVLSRFTTSTFNIAHQPTIGHSDSNVTVNVDGEDIPLVVWDTAGSEAFAPLVPMYARDAAVAIIVASAVDRDSIHSIDHWKEFVSAGTRDPGYVIVVNKEDLVTDSTRLQEACGPLMEVYHDPLIVSAKTGLLIDEVFLAAARKAMDREMRRPAVDEHIQPEPKTAKSCC
jgi:small GTP-binding protein